jgi:hypothetical protein
MISGWMRAVGLLALAPAAAFAFETVDLLPWPSTGRFPAYDRDPPRPYSIWAYTGVMHDTNVLRRDSEEGEQSDSIGRVGLGGSYEQRIVGRQSVLVEGFGEYRTYARFDELDHFAYGLRGVWLWELGNQLEGVLGARRVHRLGDLGERDIPIKDMITDDRLFASGIYRFTPRWRLTGGVFSERVEHDGRSIDTAVSWGARGGILYETPLGNAIGLEYARSEGDAPVDEELGIGTFPDNRFNQDEIAATLTYALGVTLRLIGRLGYTWREYTDVGEKFEGTTGRGLVEWLPGNKTILSFLVYREADPVLDSDALHVDRRGVAFGAAWAATAKFVLSLSLTQERRLYGGDPTIEVLGTPERDETLRFWRFGVGWEPERHWQLGGGLDWGERSSNRLGRDYEYAQVMINLRFTF